jgi:hypothetical protein
VAKEPSIITIFLKYFFGKVTVGSANYGQVTKVFLSIVPLQTNALTEPAK